MTPVIQVTELVRRYGAFTAVDHVSFHVEKGEIFGYLGANGAGKSTTIRMLCGLLEPTSGDAIVAGHRISDDSESVKRKIGYMSQKFSLYLDMSVDDNMAFFGGAYGMWGKQLEDRKDELSVLAHLKDIRRARTGDLPGGLRQRVALACALLHQPDIVFLDEPTAGVDPASRRDFWALIRKLASEGTTVFVTTHYMDEAELCGRVGLMVDGKLVALDTPAGLAETHVPGRMIALHGRRMLDAVSALRAIPGTIAVEPFGAGLHVRVEPNVSDDDLKRVLATTTASDVTFEPTKANLEDVFLVLAGRAERAE